MRFAPLLHAILKQRRYHKPMIYTHELSVIEPSAVPMPAFQILDMNGRLVDRATEPEVMDDVLYSAQRQGRISFYMTSTGEEATVIGSAAAIHPTDYVYGQYREAGVLLHRGFTLDEFMNQCFGNWKDPGKGKQMPVHYGSVKHRFFTISSPLATQIPQAAGAAYALKLDGKDNVVICYFGEGAASEGDFHAGINIAATTESPVIFFCRNNNYAISTTHKDQYRGDGIVSRAQGYGISGIRVDGNDILATYAATKKAREMVLQKGAPVIVEAITYRAGHHSTSDDSSYYRSKTEVQEWIGSNEPVHRFRNYLVDKQWWSEEQEQKERAVIRDHVIDAMKTAEREKKPPIGTMFDDVYETLPRSLQEQKAELKELLESRPQDFPQLRHHLPWKD